MVDTTRIALVAWAFAIFGSACAGALLSLEVGTCFDDWEGSLDSATQEVSDVPVVECADPHDNEVFSVSNMPDGEYPGDAAVQDWTIDRCLETFTPYVGEAYKDSRLDFGALFPTRETWADGDTEAMCVMWDFAFQKLTGPMRGAGI